MKELTELLSDFFNEVTPEAEPCTPHPRTIEGLAQRLAEPAMVDWLIARAAKTPYLNIDGYMDRAWLFNPYPTRAEKDALKEAGLPEPEYTGPSGRIHHILRKDNDRDGHDHPWNCRTIILRGWYNEDRLMPDGTWKGFHRKAGDTATLSFGEYHNITDVSEGGVWTLFITEEYQGTWGFLVDGVKVPYRTYLGLE